MHRGSSAAVVFSANIALEVTWVTAFVCGPVFQRIFGLTKTELGICLGTASVGSLLMSLVVGHITHRRGTYATLLTGLVCILCGIGVLVAATGFPMLLGGLGVVGVSAALVANANATLLAELFRDRLRRVMSLASGLWFGASAVSAPAIGMWVRLASERAWGVWTFRAPYLLDLVFVSTCLVLAAKILRPRARGAARGSGDGGSRPKPHGQGRTGKRWVWIPVLGVFHGLMVNCMLAWINPTVQAKFAANELESSLLLGTVYLGLCAGRFILASIELAVDERIILAASALSGAALFGLGLAAPTYGIAVVTLGIGGLVACATYPSILSLAGTRFPEHTSRIYGYLEGSVASVGLIGPTLVGVLADRGLPLWVALGISPLAGVVLGVLSLTWMAQDRRRGVLG